MKTIRWGIIGAGRISRKFAEALCFLEDTKLTAVASRDINRAKEFADEFKVDKTYGSYEELASDPDIDVIYIGTLHTEHKANAMLCISHGKPVLCEKPFTVNNKEAEELIAFAKEKKVFIMEAMWTRFLPVIKTVKKWLKEGRIGKVNHIKASFGYYREFDINSRLFNPEAAGGALLDVGIYPISFVTYMLDRLPDKIISSAIIGKSNVDEQNVIIFQYQEGILADLSSAVCSESGKDAVIVGDKGRILIPKFWMAEKAELYDASGSLIDEYSEPFPGNGYDYEAEEVNRCIREGKLESDIMTLKETLDLMIIMDGIRAEWGVVYPTEISHKSK